MSLTEQLSFAVDQRPPYFTPELDLQIYDEKEEEWEKLLKTNYSLETLLTALQEENLDSSNVRFADDSAKRYLTHLRETGIDTDLHYEDRMNRERLNALADADYTTIEDLHGTSDPIDVESDTGVDRDLISSIAADHLGGFSSGQSFGQSGPLTDLSPNDSFEGWKLTHDSPNRIRWVSNGRFNVTISPSPDGSTTVTCNAPETDRNAWYRKGRTIEAKTDESLTPEEALERAHRWLADHELTYEDDLATHPHIGASTRDYLALEYGITSEAELQSFVVEQPEKFESIFGADGERLRSSLEIDE